MKITKLLMTIILAFSFQGLGAMEEETASRSDITMTISNRIFVEGVDHQLPKIIMEKGQKIHVKSCTFLLNPHSNALETALKCMNISISEKDTETGEIIIEGCQFIGTPLNVVTAVDNPDANVEPILGSEVRASVGGNSTKVIEFA